MNNAIKLVKTATSKERGVYQSVLPEAMKIDIEEITGISDEERAEAKKRRIREFLEKKASILGTVARGLKGVGTAVKESSVGEKVFGGAALGISSYGLTSGKKNEWDWERKVVNKLSGTPSVSVPPKQIGVRAPNILH